MPGFFSGQQVFSRCKLTLRQAQLGRILCKGRAKVSRGKVNGDAPPAPPKHYLREWRGHRGLSQREVEQQLGWSAGHVYNVERGRSIITPRVLAGLAQAYRCEIGDLF